MSRDVVLSWLASVCCGTCGGAHLILVLCCAVSGQLEPRLLGGQADPDGAWAYGRLEVFDGQTGFVSSIRERAFDDLLGRRSVELACKTLGFEIGVQLVSGVGSALPGSDGSSLGATLTCLDDVITLDDCTLGQDSDSYGSTYADPEGDTAVALLCYNPTGTCYFSLMPVMVCVLKAFQVGASMQWLSCRRPCRRTLTVLANYYEQASDTLQMLCGHIGTKCRGGASTPHQLLLSDT